MSRIPPSITIGFSGEENSRPITFDITAEMEMWPGTTPELWYIRPGENVSYPAEITYAGNTLTWTPSLHATEKSGDTGIAQILFVKVINDSTQLLGASKRIMLSVIPSVIPVESSDVPDPLVNWVTQMRNATNAANTAADLATTKAGVADTAATNANTAATNANTKAALADEKAALATTKAGLADTAATNANTKADLADAAAANAVTKAGLADTAATNANTKADVADTAARNANTKADLANTAATNADTKAALANEKAALADEKATLANTKAALADSAASDATAAAGMIQNMTVGKTQLADGATPTVDITEVSGHKHIQFGLADGVGVSAIQVKYQKHNNGSTAPTGTWEDTPADAGATKGDYLWTRAVLSLTNNTSKTYYSISYLGEDGTGAVNSVDGVAGDVILPTFTGADGTNAGAKGYVPPPLATDNTKFLRGDASWQTIPLPSDMVGADGTDAGTHGLVPAPTATDNTKFLRGDGNWADGLPTVSSSDNGKVLRVVNGEWAVDALMRAAGVSF